MDDLVRGVVKGRSSCASGGTSRAAAAWVVFTALGRTRGWLYAPRVSAVRARRGETEHEECGSSTSTTLGAAPLDREFSPWPYIVFVATRGLLVGRRVPREQYISGDGRVGRFCARACMLAGKRRHKRITACSDYAVPRLQDSDPHQIWQKN